MNIVQVKGENYVGSELANVPAWRKVERIPKYTGADMGSMGVHLPVDFISAAWPEAFVCNKQSHGRKDAQNAISRATAVFIAAVGRLTLYALILKKMFGERWFRSATT